MRKGTKKFSLCKNYRGLKRTEGRSGRNGTDGNLRYHSSRSALRRRPQNVGQATALAEVRSLRPGHRRPRRRSRSEDAPCVSWVSQNATGSSPPPVRQPAKRLQSVPSRRRRTALPHAEYPVRQDPGKTCANGNIPFRNTAPAPQPARSRQKGPQAARRPRHKSRNPGRPALPGSIRNRPEEQGR